MDLSKANMDELTDILTKMKIGQHEDRDEQALQPERNEPRDSDGRTYDSDRHRLPERGEGFNRRGETLDIHEQEYWRRGPQRDTHRGDFQSDYTYRQDDQRRDSQRDGGYHRRRDDPPASYRRDDRRDYPSETYRGDTLRRDDPGGTYRSDAWRSGDSTYRGDGRRRYAPTDTSRGDYWRRNDPRDISRTDDRSRQERGDERSEDYMRGDPQFGITERDSFKRDSGYSHTERSHRHEEAPGEPSRIAMGQSKSYEVKPSRTQGDSQRKRHSVPTGTEHLKLLRDAEKIRQKFRDGEPRKTLRILLLGLPGVGKSSLVSSMLMAINHRGYEDIAMRGSYGVGGKAGRAAITLTVQCIHPFNHIESSGQEHRYICQPQIWDCPGLPDSDEDNIKLILRMIMDGKIPEHTNMSNLLLKSVDQIKAMKWKTRRDNEIDAVIVVHAVTDPIPENLMTAIRDAAQPNEDGQRLVPVFGIVSKLDKLDKQKVQLDAIVESFAEELGLHGAEERIFPTFLYCKDVSPGLFRKHEIDKVMCDLWNAILHAKFIKTREKPVFPFFKS